jgi:type I restriction enzyme, S subunit
VGKVSKLEELIAEYCPDGVEYKSLGEVAAFNKGNVLSKSHMKEGKFPVVAGGVKPTSFCNQYNRIGETITISSSGANAGFVSYWNEPIMLTDAFSVDPVDGIIVKFLYYSLKNMQDKILNTKTGGGVPHVYGKSIAGLRIPLPPLPVQREIVRILDNFTELTEELTKELTARKKQYEYYRDKLLTFGDEVPVVRLGDIGTIIRGSGLKKSDFTDNGIRCIHYGQIYTYYGTFTYDTKSFVSPELAAKLKKVNSGDIIIAVTSENIEDVCKCVAWLGEDDIVTGGHTAILKHNQNPKFIAYYLQTSSFFKQKCKIAHGTKVIEVAPKELEKILIPLPPLEEQERIVAILDRFDTLCNDLTSGLPAEIEARRKQYEYYRDKLLSFPKRSADKKVTA